MKDGSEWLVLLGADGVVMAVDGGAPVRWVGQRLAGCDDAHVVMKTEAERMRLGFQRVHGSGGIRRSVVLREEGPRVSLVMIEAMMIRPIEVNVGVLLRDALAPMFAQAELVNVSLNVQSAAHAELHALVDADKFVWALTSLVGAAIRHSRQLGNEQRGRVEVEVHTDPERHAVAISVRDTGPGIPQDVRPWLFEPSPETGRVSGPALKMVRDVIAAHGGGMIIKENQPPHPGGITITLRLPTL